jgi:hypothetical protein
VASGIVEPSSQDSREPQGTTAEAAAPGPQRSKLLQRLLNGSANLPQFVNDLLTTQAVVVAGTEAAGFLVERKTEGLTLRPIAHIRPDDSDAATRQAALQAFQKILQPCVAQAKDGAIEISAADTNPEPQFCLVTLLRNEGDIVAASAVITRCRNLERAQQRLMSMQLVAGYFELYTLRRSVDQSQIIAQSHQHVLQLATAVATAQGFESAAMNLCNELATRTGASRVALGWMKGNDVRVKALSHTEEFDKKQELIVELEKVMEECVDQDEPVQFDPDGGGSENVNREAAIFSRAQGGTIVLSLPLRRQAETVGVVTLEFPAKHKLGPQASTGLAVAVDLLAPQLYDRYQNDRWLIMKIGLSIKETAELAVGPKHMLAKLIIAASIVVLLAITLIRIPYRVSAPFTFDPVVKATVCCPFEGYLKDVPDGIKPGVHVTKGELLATMDTTDIQLKLNQAQAQAAQSMQESLKDDADPAKTADAAIARKEADASLKEADLYKRQIQLGEIRAPIDGDLLKGDLQDKKGSPMKQGDVMFEIAPIDNLRAEITAAERDIQDIKIGQTGWLATTSLPGEKHKFTVDRIVPLGEPKDGDNVFKIYGTLDEVVNHTAPESWRPGMAGEASITIPPSRPIVWVWTHKAINYLRLKMWTLM